MSKRKDEKVHSFKLYVTPPKAAASSGCLMLVLTFGLAALVRR